MVRPLYNMDTLGTGTEVYQPWLAAQLSMGISADEWQLVKFVHRVAASWEECDRFVGKRFVEKVGRASSDDKF